LSSWNRKSGSETWYWPSSFCSVPQHLKTNARIWPSVEHDCFHSVPYQLKIHYYLYESCSRV